MVAVIPIVGLRRYVISFQTLVRQSMPCRRSGFVESDPICTNHSAVIRGDVDLPRNFSLAFLIFIAALNSRSSRWVS